MNYRIETCSLNFIDLRKYNYIQREANKLD